MKLSTLVPGLCLQTTVYVRRTGLTLTLTYTPTGECGKLGLNAKHFCYSALLILRPTFVLHSFAQFLLESLQMCRYAKENRQRASGFGQHGKTRQKNKRPVNCTNTTVEKLQQGPPMEVASEPLRPKSVSWMWVLLDKEYDMHGWVKRQTQMCHKTVAVIKRNTERGVNGHVALP